MKENITDFYGRIIGHLDRDPVSGIVTATDFYGSILGKYIPNCDQTFDFYGVIVGRGDQTMGLIHKANNEGKNPW